MDPQLRPRIVASACLGFRACRYNGQVVPDRFVEKLGEYVNYKTVCPEIEIGLGVPREPIRVALDGGEMRLVQPASGRDVSADMRNFSDGFLSGLGETDGFILKNKSPSCGIKDVRIYSGKGVVVDKGRGFFGSSVLERFPGLAVEDEGRLKNHRIREHFLTKVFTYARFRKTQSLSGFQEKNKFLLMAYNQKEMREMGKIAAGEENREKYLLHLEKAFMRPPKCASNIDVLTHIYGFFKKNLSRKEKDYFSRNLELYREKEIPLGSMLTLLQSWIARFENEYLEDQTYFRPYPEGLIELVEECACAKDDRYVL